MAAGDAAEWLLHAESDLTYAKLGQAEPAILRNQVTFTQNKQLKRLLKQCLFMLRLSSRKHMICKHCCYCFGTAEFRLARKLSKLPP
jgi:hypothetical protein